MAVRLFLGATLRQYATAYNAETGYEVVVEPASTVRDLSRRLGIPEKEVKLIMVEGVAADWDTTLAGNERVALFPPVGGG
ncbi:MAG TPA: MoaD/ThiS family protein [Syntrophobacteraceae bacterium]|nr:MoaD/ThiS family protein [Syntrophobacteraceae bacterium]